MIQVIKFQSKPNKARKYEYTLQKNGLYKSNGNQGSEFSSAYFNHLNPVLEVKKDNAVIKVGQTITGGKVTKMFLTSDKQDVIIYVGIISKLLSMLTIVNTPVIAEKPKEPEVKPFDVAAAKKFIKTEFILQADDGTELTEEGLNTCCGLNEVGRFVTDKNVVDEIKKRIDVYTSRSSYKDKKPLVKDINDISTDSEFINELVVANIQSALNFKNSFIAVVNNKEQSYVLKAFESMNQDLKGNLDMIEFKSNSTKNKLTLITYTIG